MNWAKARYGWIAVLGGRLLGKKLGMLFNRVALDRWKEHDRRVWHYWHKQQTKLMGSPNMPKEITPQTIRDLVQSGKLKLTDDGTAEGHLDEDVAAAIQDMADLSETYDRAFDRGQQGYDRFFDRTDDNPN